MKSLILLVTVLVSRIGCLSLDEIHSSSQNFKSISHNRDKSLRSAIDTIRRRRQEYPFAHQSQSLPLKPIRSYERLVPFNEKLDQQLVDNLLGNKKIDSQYLDESLGNDLLSTELALKLSQLLESDNKGESDVGHRIYNRINRKMKRSTTSKHKYLSQTNAVKQIKSDGKQFKNIKNLNKHKTNSIKSLTKRKSGRRVLNDHFNIEESHPNVINKNKDTKTIKSLTNSLKSKVRANKKFENQIKSKDVKKTIKKRKVENNSGLSSETKDNKTTTKGLKTTDNSVVKELNDILSDDYKNDKKEGKELENKTLKVLNSKEDNKKAEDKPEIIKRKNKRSDPNIQSLIDNLDNNNENTDKLSEDVIVYPNVDPQESVEKSSSNEMPNTNQDLNEWLRREFYENMAKTLATMRKKRSQEVLSDENDAIEESETIGDNIIAIDGGNEDTDILLDDEFKNYGKSSDDSDNDYVIAAIDDDNKDNNYANDGNDENDNNEEDINELVNEWSDLADNNRITTKSKRSVSSYFGDLDNNMETNEINSRRFTRVNDNLESIEDSLLNEALDFIRETAAKGSEAEVNTDKVANRLDAAYDIEDMRTALEDLKNTFDKINNENENEVQETYEIDLTSPLFTTEQIDVQKKDSSFDNSLSELDSKCFGLDLLSSDDCSSVSDLLPTEGLRYSFTESCNWHQICYTCGEIYGLLSSDCDAGFLEANRLSCAGSPSCEAFARLVLSPLRQSRVFYKSSVPQLCYQFQCIRDFLFDTKNTKH